MIEFMEDGPFAGTNGTKPVKMRILGLGRTGIRVTDHLVLRGLRPYDIWALDTCRETLESGCAHEKFLLGEDRLRGLGARGERCPADAVANEAEAVLRDAVAGCDYVVAALSLGGATGVALARKLLHVAEQTQTRLVVFASMPLASEGGARQVAALRALSDLRAEADAVLVYSAERFSRLAVADEDVRRGLTVMCRLMAKSLEGIAQIICKGGLIQLSFSDIRSLYGRMEDARQAENCWAAFAEVRAEDGPAKLVEEALASDLLTDEVWQRADHAMLCLSGGQDLSLVEVQNVIRELQKFLPANFPVATTANLEEKCGGKLRLTMLLAATRVTMPVEEVLFAESKQEESIPAGRNVVPLRERLYFEPEPLIDEGVFAEAANNYQREKAELEARAAAEMAQQPMQPEMERREVEAEQLDAPAPTTAPAPQLSMPKAPFPLPTQFKPEPLVDGEPVEPVATAREEVEAEGPTAEEAVTGVSDDEFVEMFNEFEEPVVPSQPSGPVGQAQDHLVKPVAEPAVSEEPSLRAEADDLEDVEFAAGGELPATSDALIEDMAEVAAPAEMVDVPDTVAADIETVGSTATEAVPEVVAELDEGDIESVSEEPVASEVEAVVDEAVAADVRRWKSDCAAFDDAEIIELAEADPAAMAVPAPGLNDPADSTDVEVIDVELVTDDEVEASSQAPDQEVVSASVAEDEADVPASEMSDDLAEADEVNEALDLASEFANELDESNDLDEGELAEDDNDSEEYEDSEPEFAEESESGRYRALDDFDPTDDGTFIEEEEDEEALVMANRTGLPKENNRLAKRGSRQVELAFESNSRGRFDKSAESIYNGEDLDVPTFRRRHLKLRL